MVFDPIIARALASYQHVGAAPPVSLADRGFHRSLRSRTGRIAVPRPWPRPLAAPLLPLSLQWSQAL